jgi:hypothetical protein
MPPVLVAFILLTVASLSATLGMAVYCCTHTYATGYDRPSGPEDRPLQTPDGH